MPRLTTVAVPTTQYQASAHVKAAACDEIDKPG